MLSFRFSHFPGIALAYVRWLILAAVLVTLLTPAGYAGAAQVTLVPDATAPSRAVTVVGSGFPPRARGSVKLPATTAVQRLRVDAEGRFRVVLALPQQIDARDRTLVIRAGDRRRELPLAVGQAGASLTVGARSRRMLLQPYAALSGAARTVSGRGWPRRVRIEALLGGRLLQSVRTDRRGRLEMRLAPSVATGTARLVFRAGRRRLTVPFRVTAGSTPAPAPVPVPAPAPPAQPGATQDPLPGARSRPARDRCRR